MNGSNWQTPPWLNSNSASQQVSGLGSTRQSQAYEQLMRSNPWVQRPGTANVPKLIQPVAESSYVPRGTNGQPSGGGGLVNYFTQQRMRPPGGYAVQNYQQQQIADAQQAMQSRYQPQFQPQFQQPQFQQPQFQQLRTQPYQPQLQQGNGLLGMFSPNRSVQSYQPGYRGYGSRQFRGVY